MSKTKSPISSKTVSSNNCKNFKIQEDNLMSSLNKEGQMLNWELEKENLTFEIASKELDNLIEAMEEGNISVEEIECFYERGAKLLDYCNKMLNQAQGRITIIKNNLEERFRD